MEFYHYFFYILRIIILIAILLMRFGLIPINGKYYIIIETLFKFSLGIFIIIYFLNKDLNVEKQDKILFLTSGVVLISMIDYDEFIKAINEKYNFK
jgi:hypothetical protein